MDPHYLEDLPESPTTRILSGTASGLGIGAIVGSVFANWAELPQTLPGRSALGVTGDLFMQSLETLSMLLRSTTLASHSWEFTLCCMLPLQGHLFARRTVAGEA